MGRDLRRWTGLIEKSPVERLAEIRERIAEIDERMKGLLTRFFNVEIFGHEGPLVAERRQLVAEAAELERLKSELATQLPPSVTPLVMPPVTPPVTPPGDPDVKTAEDRARRLLQIEKSLNTQLFQLRHQGADRIRAEHAKLETELEKFKRQLAEPLPAGGTEAEFEKVAEERAQQLERIERLQFGAAAVRDDKLAEIARREKERGEEKADRVKQANKRVVESLGFELEALKKVERERFVDVALRRLSAEATPKLREEVERLAGALYDELKAIEKRNEAEREANQLRTEAKALIESLRTAQEAYADEMARLRELRDLEEGGIDQETFARASEQAYDRMLDASRKWSDGVRRAIRDYVDEAGDAAKQFERVTTRALQASEDAFVQWAQTGKFSAKDLFNTIAEEALRAAYRMAVAKPLDDIFDTIFSAIGGALAGGVGTTPSGTSVPSGPIIIKTHTGGVIGRDAFRPAWSTLPCSTARSATTAAASLAALAMCRSGRKPARACSRPGRCAAWRRYRPSNPRFMSRSMCATPRRVREPRPM